jgi:hypothetical protein
VADNGIYGVILGMLAKVAASQGMFAGITMRAQWIVKWDSGPTSNYTACWAFGLMLSSYFQLSSLLIALMAASRIL